MEQEIDYDVTNGIRTSQTALQPNQCGTLVGGIKHDLGWYLSKGDLSQQRIG